MPGQCARCCSNVCQRTFGGLSSIFADAQEEVVLLLAEGVSAGPLAHFNLHQFHNPFEDIAQLGAPDWHAPVQKAERWTGSLVGIEAQSILSSALAHGHLSTLKGVGRNLTGSGNRQ